MDAIKMVILGTVAMLLPVSAIILFVIIYYRRQRLQREAHEEALHQAMLEASVLSQEVVRRQIGGDLHDEIGTLLSATRMSLSQLSKHQLSTDKGEQIFNRTQELLNEALNNVRRISKDLMPSTLDEFGLIEALKDFSQKMTLHTNMPIYFVCGELNKRYDSKVELALYRTAQELVNNALKHAEASQIKIILLENKAELLLQVIDDGKGFDLNEVNQPSRGIGIRNIESRISLIKGQVKFDVEIGKGSNFIISVPLK
ncbi:sensor histidine kinase [Arcicella rigui]|uniref:Oxygen sensor histidine kinase NreB n=1 Tax=Arcicella rigui TaxID=797020 RepID=A0ABU5Q6N2_9BACT|nr:sensor histidine kinase [Arcicella rigui]MEA5138471.1 sensor histidine kinase [Arcicella rigui]